MLTRPRATKEPRQPKAPIKRTTRGGDMALPKRAKEWVMPCAKPRLPGAVQLAIARVAVGKVAPSPIPSSTRAAKSDQKFHTAPVRMVAPAQMNPEMVSVLRAPKRSANQPPEICSARYAQPTAPQPSPYMALLRPDSFWIAPAAV